MARFRGVALGGRGHVFGAVVDYFYGAAGFLREERGVRGDHRGIFFLAAESASGFRLDHAHPIFGQAEQRDQRLVDVVGALQRAPDGDAVGVVDLRDHALGLDVELLLRAGLIFAFDDEIGGGPHLVHVAFFHVEGFEDVVRAPDDFLAREGILEG